MPLAAISSRSYSLPSERSWLRIVISPATEGAARSDVMDERLESAEAVMSVTAALETPSASGATRPIRSASSPSTMLAGRKAIARSKANGGELEDEQAALILQHLLSSTAVLLPKSQEPAPSPQLSAPTSVSTHHSATATATTTPGYSTHGGQDDAENPLQLLASASGMAFSPRPLPNTRFTSTYKDKDL
ncbi:hypothetical protein V493_06023 [Pseudogymnoascus sp. VKM F-4281 (FW-2241)]|nr:hypothetical protein V493_06023 [Pseudogymnoascus sp. VKM F-4281 (FW-2241)]